MLRREFIAGLGYAAAWPVLACAQQLIPVVGVLSISGPQAPPDEFRQALKDTGFVQGQNVMFEFRFASGQFDLLPALAVELVGRKVDVIFAAGAPAAVAAKAATATIPIVFALGEDPVKEGLVASLNRPGGNVTGITGFTNQLIAKRLELMHQAIPSATVIGFLVNPNNPNAEPDTNDARSAALALGLTLRVLAATSERDFEEVFGTISQERIDALLVGVEPFFRARREQLVALAAHHAVPTLWDRNIFPAVGGLMSYGTNLAESQRHSGAYVGRILRGAMPADLPVLQPTKFELVINLKTAKALGLTIPETLLATADEVIQ